MNTNLLLKEPLIKEDLDLTPILAQQIAFLLVYLGVFVNRSYFATQLSYQCRLNVILFCLRITDSNFSDKLIYIGTSFIPNRYHYE